MLQSFKQLNHLDIEILLLFFNNHMTMELRYILMQEYPELYNRFVERKIMHTEQIKPADKEVQ